MAEDAASKLYPRQGERVALSPSERTRLLRRQCTYYGAGGCLAQLPGSPGPWHESCGLNHLLRDRGGRIYIARLVDPSSQPFIFEAAAKQPDLLYSPESPFWPIYDAVEYSPTYEIGVVITQMPPFPLSRLLAPGQTRTRDELRRVLERMQNFFQHLVTLEEHGVTLNGTMPWDSWIDSLYITSSTRFWLIPAYLQRVTDGQGSARLARGDRYEERLPAPPVDAWPVAPFEGEGGVAGLPWSQATAYSDPRVQGPRVVSIGPPARSARLTVPWTLPDSISITYSRPTTPTEMNINSGRSVGNGGERLSRTK